MPTPAGLNHEFSRRDVGTVWFSHLGHATGIERTEAWGAAKLPPVHKTTSHKKRVILPEVSRLRNWAKQMVVEHKNEE